MCVEVTMCRVHLRLCSAIVLSSIPLCTLDFEVKVDTLIDVEGEWVEIVLDHVWVEAEHRWLDAWMEMNRHRQLFEGMLLVCSDLFDSGSRSQITEIEFWGEHAWRTSPFCGGDWGNTRNIDGWILDPWPLHDYELRHIKVLKFYLPVGDGV
jgi:hypothetical protein